MEVLPTYTRQHSLHTHDSIFYMHTATFSSYTQQRSLHTHNTSVYVCIIPCIHTATFLTCTQHPLLAHDNIPYMQATAFPTRKRDPLHAHGNIPYMHTAVFPTYGHHSPTAVLLNPELSADGQLLLALRAWLTSSGLN